jgi:hypothetical protein
MRSIIVSLAYLVGLKILAVSIPKMHVPRSLLRGTYIHKKPFQGTACLCWQGKEGLSRTGSMPPANASWHQSCPLSLLQKP